MEKIEQTELFFSELYSQEEIIIPKSKKGIVFFLNFLEKAKDKNHDTRTNYTPRRNGLFRQSEKKSA
jgi:hypothetical protein